MSIRWWRTQHPAPVFGGGADSGIDPSMLPPSSGTWPPGPCGERSCFGVRYAVERRRQRQAAAYAVGFLESEDPTGLEGAR
jgi:heme exporter protein C